MDYVKEDTLINLIPYVMKADEIIKKCTYTDISTTVSTFASNKFINY
jgi:hypothetical protein